MKKALFTVLAMMALISCTTTSYNLTAEETTRTVPMAEKNLVPIVTEAALNCGYTLSRVEKGLIQIRTPSKGQTWSGQLIKVVLVESETGTFVQVSAEMYRGGGLASGVQIYDWGESNKVVNTFMAAFDKALSKKINN
jgi:hypothetical protein